MTNNEPDTFADPNAYALHPIDHDCEDCMDYASHENMHQDEGHEGDSMPAPHCRVCQRDIPKPLRKGAKARITPHVKQSHAACYAAGAHDKSREGRAGCRALGGPSRDIDA